ncbi:MAG TPA: TetR/AcrR family transcriptional regulator [Sphingomonadales bacterium]|nr:TetR/AcrR family transcriptional regulator [Sphingomonadales bacterium]
MGLDKPKLAGEEYTAKPLAIMEAALEIFSEKGFSATRLDEVAARAGVAKGTLYLYFDSKKDIFKKVVETALKTNVEPLEKKFEAHAGATQDFLNEMFEFFGKLLSENRIGVMPKLIITEAGHFPDLAAYYRDKVVLRIHRLFTHVIERGIERGEFRKVDAAASARILMAPFLMLALVRQTPVLREGLRIDPKAHVAAARDVLLSGLLQRNGA